jgi:hypothetical protein
MNFYTELYFKARTWSMALILGMSGTCSPQPYCAVTCARPR